MPSRKIEAQLEALAALKRSNTAGRATAESVALLRKSLSDALGLIVAKAAEAAAVLRVTELLPDLLKAYGRLFEEGSKRDQQCSGKLAIAQALREFEYSESEPFVRGLSYHQWEPVWGTETDTAGPLRSICSLAILQCTDVLREQKLWYLTHGLSDAMATVRLDVARALEETGGRESVLLLRLKARMGDEQPGVTGQIFQSLLNLEGTAAIPFVAEFLEQRGWPDKDVEIADVAAIALGSSRLPEALELLMESWNTRAGNRMSGEAVLRALSSSRQQRAIDFLAGIIRDGRQFEALAAIEALTLNQDSESIRAVVAAAAEERDNPEVTAGFARAFR